MTETTEHLNRIAERGLPDGLGSQNTQPGAPVTHSVQPDSLVYGLGSADTQHEASEPGYVAIDHTHDADESGLPLGLGSDNTQDGPAVPHPVEAYPVEFGLGSPETQHAHPHE